MSAPLRLAAAALLVALAPACRCSRTDQGTAADSGSLDEIRPNYDLQGPTNPLAARLCQALYALPDERRAQCCQAGSVAMGVIGSQCTAMLSSALRIGAVKLPPEAVDRCVAAMTAAYSGCGWVGPNEVILPEECTNLFQGTLVQGASCRSTLECQGELRCAGGGPTDIGRCAPAGPPDSPCEIAVDGLATFTRQDVTRSHPECTGFCQRRRCRAPLPPGEKCLVDVQCPRGTHCGKGACVPGQTGKEGDVCSPGGCQAPLRCIQETCRAPAPEGAPCSQHRECLGACIPADGGRGSRCGPGCAFR